MESPIFIKAALPIAHANERMSNLNGVRLLRLAFNAVTLPAMSTAKGPPTAQKAETMAIPVRSIPKIDATKSSHKERRNTPVTDDKKCSQAQECRRVKQPRIERDQFLINAHALEEAIGACVKK